MDKQIIKRFKKFQQTTGKFVDLEIEKVKYDRVSFDKGDVFKFVKGQNKYIRKYVNANPGGTPVLGSSLENDCIYSKVKPLSFKDVVTEESVSFNKDNAKGSRAFYRNYPYLMDRHHIAIIPNKDYVLPQYLQVYLNRFLESKKYGWGAHVASEGEIKKYKLPVPKPLDEKCTSLEIQKALVAFIDFHKNDNKEKLETVNLIGELTGKMERLVVPLFFQKDESAAKKFDVFCKQRGINLRLTLIDFVTVALGVICNITMGQSPTGKDLNKNKQGKPFHQGKTNFGEKYLRNATSWTTNSKKEAKEGDILVSMRAPAGAVNVTNYDISIGRGLAAVTCLEGIDTMFIYHYLKYNEERIKQVVPPISRRNWHRRKRESLFQINRSF